VTDSGMESLIDVTVNVFIFALGASIGSFINVVVYRLPAKLSILWPPSRCPDCLHKLKPYDNIPLLGWIWLKGRCRHCRNRISPRYFLVEGLTGFIFLSVYWAFQSTIFTLGYWAFCSWLLTLALIDLDTMRLPDQLTKSGLILGLVFQMTVGFLLEANGVGVAKHLMSGIAGATVGLWLFDIIALVGSWLFKKTVQGAGDSKLVAMIGAWIGWRFLLLSILVSCFTGVLVMGVAILLSRHKIRQKIPFGPFLAFGGVFSIFSGGATLSYYWRYVHLFIP